MKKKYFLFFIFLILLYAISINLSAQTNLIKNQLNHFQVVFPAILSSSFITSFLILELMYNIDLNEDITYDLVDSMLFFAILPIYFFDIPKGLLFCGVFLGLNLIADYLWDVDEDFIAQIPANGYMDFSFFSTYAIYREGRVRAKKGLYNENWREKAFGNSEFFSYFIPTGKDTKWKPYSFIDLALSPISKDNLSDLLILIIIPEGFLAPFLQEMILGNDFSQSVFNTGKLFIGTHELPFLLGIPAMVVFLYLLCSFVAIGEESFFRGFLYEELGATFNDWVGKATDMILFPLFHVSSEIKFYQDNPQYFWNYFLRRSLLTFIIDLTYDRGGLSRSVALHFWIDFTQLIAYYLIYGGVPHQSFTDIMGLSYKRIEIQFTFTF